MQPTTFVGGGYKRSLAALLPKMQPTLTHLNIRCNDENIVRAILDICPNITHLHWALNEETLWTPCFVDTFSLPDLTCESLRLKYLSYEAIQDDDELFPTLVLKVIERSPHLETFYRFRRRNTPRTMTAEHEVILEYLVRCQNLQRVDLDRDIMTPFIFESTGDNPCMINHVLPKYPRAPENTFAIMNRLRSKLQTLGIMLPYIPLEQWSEIKAAGGFPRLNTINLYMKHPSSQDLSAFFDLISLSTELKTIRLFGDNATDTQLLEHLTCAAPHLLRLELHGCQEPSMPAFTTLVRALTNLQHLIFDTEPTFWEEGVHHPFRNPTFEQLLSAISLLPNLRSLRLANKNVLFTNSMAKYFTKKLKCTKLAYITLDMIISDSGLQILDGIESLRSITLILREWKGADYDMPKIQSLLGDNSKLRQIVTKVDKITSRDAYVLMPKSSSSS